jgi:hypothetical protein
VLERRDRREWGLVGLVVLGYGLGLAPLAHAALQHGELDAPDPSDNTWLGHGPGSPRGDGAPHSHSHTHPAGSIEHLCSIAATASAAPAVAPVGWDLVWTGSGEVRARPGRSIRSRAQPQGP